MPAVFKTLTSISVWILFIHGLVAIVWGGLEMWVFNDEIKLTTMAVISCSLGTANLLMAAAAAKLRDMM